MIKIAIPKSMVMPTAGGTPIAPSAPSGGAKTTAPSSTTTTDASKEVKEQVMRMQDSMRAFGEALDKDKEAVAAKLKIAVSDVERLSGAIRNTGTSNGPSSDGVWGPNTQAALDTLSKFFGITFSSPAGGFKNASPEEIIAASKKNVDGIVKQMQSLGFAVPKHLGGTAASIVLDAIPDTLTEQNSDPRVPAEAKHPVTAKALSSIWSFYSFISSLSLGQNLENAFQAQAAKGKVSLEKIAEQILSTNIIRLSQAQMISDDDKLSERGDALLAEKARERAGAGAGGAGPTQQFLESQKGKAPPAGLKHMTVAQFTGAIRWFARRASMNLLVIQNSIKSGEEDLNGQPLYSQEDLKKAIDYDAAMQSLADTWFKQIDKFLASGQDPKLALVDPIELTDGARKRPESAAGGLARTRAPGGGAGARTSADGIDHKKESLGSPPIQYEMDLYDALHESGSEPAQWLLQYMNNHVVRLVDFSTRSPDIIASMYMNDAVKQSFNSDMVYVENLSIYLSKFMDEMLYVWSQRARASMDSNMYRADLFKQQSNLSKWKTALTGLGKRTKVTRMQRAKRGRE